MSECAKKELRKVLRSVRSKGKRNLFWWKGPPYNAGDWVGPFLFKAITSAEPIEKQAIDLLVRFTLQSEASRGGYVRTRLSGALDF